MAESTGKPIRSSDLEKRAAESEQIADSALQSITAAERKILHLRRALRASEPPTPTDSVPADNLGTAHLSARPGPGAGRIGRHVASQTSKREDAFLTEPRGTGIIEILRADEPWSFVSQDKTDTVEARLDPSQTLRYDEIKIPVISGKITATVYGPNKSYTYGPFTRTRLLRFDEPRLANGRVQIQSSAGANTEDGFLHVGAGISLMESNWASQWSLEGDFVAPFDTTIEVKKARLFPSGRAATDLSFIRNGSDVGSVVSLSKGESFVVKASNLDPTLSATHLAVDYRAT